MRGAMLSEYQQLDTVVKTAMPLPAIDWNEFAAGISSEASKLDAPVKHYRLKFATWSRVAALAAMVTIIVGAIVKLRPANPRSDAPNSVAVAHPRATNSNPVEVEIGAPPTLAKAPVTDIQIGQPSGFATADYHAADSIISSSPTINWIAAGGSSAQDNEPPLY